jgi:hypothetical protein
MTDSTSDEGIQPFGPCERVDALAWAIRSWAAGAGLSMRHLKVEYSSSNLFYAPIEAQITTWQAHFALVVWSRRE